MTGLSLSPMEDLLEERAWRVGKNRAFNTDRAGPVLTLLLPHCDLEHIT